MNIVFCVYIIIIFIDLHLKRKIPILIKQAPCTFNRLFLTNQYSNELTNNDTKHTIMHVSFYFLSY